MSKQHRPIYQIAADILRTWPKVHYTARPYLDAMRCLATKHDKYGYDDAEGIVLRFLTNAGSFRGEEAKKLKAELRAAVK